MIPSTINVKENFMLTAIVSKIKKSVLLNVIFTLKVLSENGIFLSKRAYFLQDQEIMQISQKYE